MTKQILKVGTAFIVGMVASSALLYADAEKVTYDDVSGKRYYSKYDVPGWGIRDIRTLFYSNKNFKIEVNILGWRDAGIAGEWSIENGVVVTEGIPNDDTNKSIGTIEPDFVNNKLISHVSGRGVILTDNTLPLVKVDNMPSDITPVYDLQTSDIKGKKMVVESEYWYFFNNMTCITIDNGDTTFMGSWKVEEGVLIIDGGWDDLDLVNRKVTAEISTMLFNAKPAGNVTFDVYMNAMKEPYTVIINTFTDILATDPIPAPFTNDVIAYSATVEDFSGKKIIVEYEENGNTVQDSFTFNDNMTYTNEYDIQSGNPEISTGIWSVEEGVLVLDTVYSDHYISQAVIHLSEAAKNGITLNYLGIDISDSAVEGEGKGIFASSDTATVISGFPDAESPTASPAIIMYLLN